MVAPLIVMAGIAAGSSLVQFLNSERGRRLERKERDRLQKLIDKIQAPEFDIRQLNPPELKQLEQYVPEVASMVYEAEPELVNADSDRAIAGKAAQDAALRQFQSISRGEDPLGDLSVVKAINDAIEASGAQRQAILADMARKGVSPSSSAYGLLQFNEAAQSQRNMFNAALDAALAERQRRDQAIGKSAELGRSILGFETDLEKINADTINEINRRNTAARRQYLTNRANALNEAQRANQRERQRIYEANELGRYKAQLEARDLYNKQQEANTQTELAKLGRSLGNTRFPEIRNEIQSQNQFMQGLSDAAMLGASVYGRQPVQQQATIPQQPYANAYGQPYQSPTGREVMLPN